MEVKTMFTTALKEHEEKYRQIGIKEGEKRGIRKKAIDAALKMLAKGAEMDFIVDVTGLTVEEIEQLKLEMKDKDLS